MARGYPAQAAKVAAGMAMYQRRVSQTSGAMAAAAVAHGDLRQAGEWMAKAYDNLGNGQELHLGQTQNVNGQPAIQYQIVDAQSGKVVHDGMANAEEMGGMAQKMMSGQAWLSETIKIAQGAGLIKGGKGGAQRAPTPTEVARSPEAVQAQQAMNAAGAAYRDNPSTETKAKFQDAASAAVAAGMPQGIATATLSNYGLGKVPTSAAERKQQAAEEKNQQAVEGEKDPMKKRLIMSDQSFAQKVEQTKLKMPEGFTESLDAHIQTVLGADADPASVATNRAIALQLLRSGQGGDIANAVTVAKTLYDPSVKLTAHPDGSISFEDGEPIFLPQNALHMIFKHRQGAAKPAAGAASAGNPTAEDMAAAGGM
jgi:hypothetical protein